MTCPLKRRLLPLVACLLLAMSADAQSTRPHEVPADWSPASNDMQTVLMQARQFARDGLHGPATTHFLWLWDHVLDHDPHMVGVRSSFMASDMEDLARQYPPAAAAIEARRDHVQQSFAGGMAGVDSDAFDDWVVLNEMLGDDQRVIDWLDRHRDDTHATRLAARSDFRVEPMLIERGRYDRLILLYPDPIRSAREAAASYRGLKAWGGNDPQYQEVAVAMHVESIGRIYASLLAAGRDETAAELLRMTEVPTGLPDERPAMVEAAVQFNVAHRDHLALLDAAEADGANVTTLRRRLTQALEDATTDVDVD